MLLHCPHCNARVDAKEVTSHEWNTDPEIPFSTDRATFCICSSCNAPLLARQDWDYDEQRDGVEWGDPERAYPPTYAISPTVPAPLRDAFLEARTCVQSRCYLAAALMCRRTLETLCHHHGAAGQNLAAALKKLHDDKVIDDRLFEWAEALRHDGNLAAHDPDAAITREDASDLVDFTQAILDYVFVLRDRFETFKQRRDFRAKKKKASTTAK